MLQKSVIETELIRARAEAFELREKCKLLSQEVAHHNGRQVKFNNVSKSYWEVEKSARSLKRKKIKQFLTNAMESLPAEFKPVEVCQFAKLAK